MYDCPQNLKILRNVVKSNGTNFDIQNYGGTMHVVGGGIMDVIGEGMNDGLVVLITIIVLALMVMLGFCFWKCNKLGLTGSTSYFLAKLSSFWALFPPMVLKIRCGKKVEVTVAPPTANISVAPPTEIDLTPWPSVVIDIPGIKFAQNL